VRTSGGDDDGAFDGFLASDVGEIDGGGGVVEEAEDVGGGGGLGGETTGEPTNDLGKSPCAVDLEPFDDGGLGGVGGWDDDPLEPAGAGHRGEGDDALDGAEAAVEREFAGEEVSAVVQGTGLGVDDADVGDRGGGVGIGGGLAEGVREGGLTAGRGDAAGALGVGLWAWHDARDDKEADGDGEVVDGTFLADIGRSEVDDNPTVWVRKPGVEHGAADAFLGFLDAGIGKANEDGRRGCPVFAGRGFLIEVDLDFAGEGVDAVEKVGLDSGYHIEILSNAFCSVKFCLGSFRGKIDPRFHVSFEWGALGDGPADWVYDGRTGGRR
jgi:hypothetical protein